MRPCDRINVLSLLPRVTVPTIVFHSHRDRIAPPEEARILAAEIPGARFVPLTSANQILLAEEPAWKVFREELASFLKCAGAQVNQPGSNRSCLWRRAGLCERFVEVRDIAGLGLKTTLNTLCFFFALC